MFRASGLLHDRTFKSSRCAQPVASAVPSRCPVYREYSDEQLCRAYEAVKDGVSLRHAAEQYGIPKSTLSDRITGRVKFGAHSGPERYLSDDEERELVSFICQSARMGYAKTKKEVLSIVEQTSLQRGEECPSLKWLVGIIQAEAPFPYITNS